MLKYFTIALSVWLILLSGCGGEPAQNDNEVTEEVTEEVEIIEVTAMADPGNLVDYRGQDGEELFFMVTGDAMGSVWGTDIYTDDSYLATAAVHAGVLEDGESGYVMVTILPGEESYEGSMQNGVESWDYPAWSGSYIVEVIPENVEVEAGALPDPGNLIDYRGRDGEVIAFEVTGDAIGSVWGTDVYTDDSDLSAVAVHAGVLEDGETGTVMVEILPGEESYTGSTRNGVESWDYPEWSGSYAVY